MVNGRITRRGFVRGVGAALAAPYVITSNALGGAEKPAASERITMGTIGLGGRGKHRHAGSPPPPPPPSRTGKHNP